jgi:hypothetical protein
MHTYINTYIAIFISTAVDNGQLKYAYIHISLTMSTWSKDENNSLWKQERARLAPIHHFLFRRDTLITVAALIMKYCVYVCMHVIYSKGIT